MSGQITLKAARINAGLTQEEMAKKLDIAASTYNKWENNPQNITIIRQKQISEILNFPSDNIIFLP